MLATTMQQTTIQLDSNHPLRAMTGLAKHIALPAEYTPQRFPSFPALERTAVMSFNQPTTVVLAASTETKVVLARQPVYPLWAHQVKTGSHSVSYLTSTMIGSDTQTVYSFLDGTSGAHTGNTVGDVYRPTVINSYPMAGLSYAIMGIDDHCGNRPFIYAPYNSSIYAVINASSGAPAASDLIVNFETWLAPGVSSMCNAAATMVLNQKNTMTAAVNSANYLGLDGMWIRPSTLTVSYAANQLSTTLYTVTIQVVTGTAVFTSSLVDGGSLNVAATNSDIFVPVVEAIEFTNSTIPWRATRMTAAAVLLTNVSQVLNKAGTVLAGRLSPDTKTPWNVTSSYVNGLHPAEKAWLPLETGAYTYAPPSTDLVDFRDYTVVTFGSIPTPFPCYRLDNTAMFNVMYLTAGSVAETMAVTATWALEFRTSSSLFQIALSGLPIEVFHQAQLGLAAAGYFFSNHDHKSVLSYVIEGLSMIHPTLGRIANTARGLWNATGSGKQKKPKQPKQPKAATVRQAPMIMAPTTAAKSGITGNGKGKGGKKLKGGLDIYLAGRGRKR